MAKDSPLKKTIVCPKCILAGSVSDQCQACKGTGKITLKMIVKERQELTLKTPRIPEYKLKKFN